MTDATSTQTCKLQCVSKAYKGKQLLTGYEEYEVTTHTFSIPIPFSPIPDHQETVAITCPQCDKELRFHVRVTSESMRQVDQRNKMVFHSCLGGGLLAIAAIAAIIFFLTYAYLFIVIGVLFAVASVPFLGLGLFHRGQSTLDGRGVCLVGDGVIDSPSHARSEGHVLLFYDAPTFFGRAIE